MKFALADLGAQVRLVVIVGAMMVAAFFLLLRSEGTLPDRLRGALLAAFAPLVLAWPRALRRLQNAAAGPGAWDRDVPYSGSYSELRRIRRAGAI